MNGSTSSVLRCLSYIKSASIKSSLSHRWLSSIGNRFPPTSNRAYPQYKIYNPRCVLNVYPMSPNYKKYGATNGVFVERQGKMMMEFIPSIPQHNDTSLTDAENKANLDPNSKITVALSVDEIGQFLAKTSSTCKYNTSNDSKMEFKRLGRKYLNESTSNSSTTDGFYKAHGIITSSSDQTPEKILTIQPSHDGSMIFQVHQSSTTLNVSVSSGEMEILKCLFRDSITHLLGWDSILKKNDVTNMNAASNAQTAPRFRTGGPGIEENLF